MTLKSRERFYNFDEKVFYSVKRQQNNVYNVQMGNAISDDRTFGTSWVFVNGNRETWMEAFKKFDKNNDGTVLTKDIGKN